LLGGPGVDRLRGPDQRNVWRVTSRNSGKLNHQGFGGIESLAGGSGDDEFVLEDGAGVDGAVIGGGGINTLDYTAYTTAVLVNLTTGSATGTAGTSDIAVIMGGSASDTLTGPITNATWTLNGLNAGDVGGVSFSNVENLTGADDNNDTFVVMPGGQLSGVIDGGARGFDSLMIDGGVFGNVAYEASGRDSGTVRLDDYLLTYTGLEPIVDNSNAATRRGRHVREHHVSQSDGQLDYRWRGRRRQHHH